MNINTNFRLLYLYFLFPVVLMSSINVKCQIKKEIDFQKEYPNAEFIPEIIYGKGGEKDLKLDLFLPKAGNPPYIGIIFIHGGGWKNLSKEYLKEWGMFFADRGYVAVSIDYRLSGEAKFPAAVEDCKCAVRWMRANAEKYRINPGKIAVFGESAGGHLAALLGTSGGAPELEGTGGHAGYSSRPDLVFPVYGVFDLQIRAKETKAVTNALNEFIGCSYDDCPAKYISASPITYIDRSDPPFLLFHSTGDSTVPYRHSVIFEKKLKEAGVLVEFSTTVGSKHGYVLWEPHFKPTCEQMIYFMNKYFVKN
jgi:acetyl esterase/lipase